jgi:Ca-activated chloride channel family protein
LCGNIIDDINIYQANQLLDKKEYQKAYDTLDNISNKSDKIYYNMANTLYKQGKYKEAIKNYDKVKQTSLNYKKLHNLGNSYAKLKDYDKAIKSYEEALRVKNDKDTKYNLNLIKKKQQQDKEQKNKKDKKQKDKKDKNQNQKKDGDNKKSKDKKSKKKEENGEKKKDIKEKKDNISKNHQENKKKKIEDVKKDENNTTTQETLKNTDLSHLEEKKYQKLLNNRELNTLLIPLKTKGDKNAQDIAPW